MAPGMGQVRVDMEGVETLFQQYRQEGEVVVPGR